MMLDRDLTLSQATLGGVDGRIQEILDCLPPASNLIMSIEEAPTQGGWIINKPVTIESTSGTVRLLCSTEGIQIRYVREKCIQGWTLQLLAWNKEFQHTLFF